MQNIKLNRDQKTLKILLIFGRKGGAGIVISNEFYETLAAYDGVVISALLLTEEVAENIRKANKFLGAWIY